MFKFFTLDNFNFHNKIVGVRIDINSPIINGKIVYNERIVRAVKTLRELVKQGAKVIILAHQGRNGGDDCVSLKAHQKLIEQELNKQIKFSKEISGESFNSKVSKLRAGDVLLLENLRFFDDETNLEKEDNKIDKLFHLFNYYVLDAFSAAHRAQKSILATSSIPIIAGRSMEREILHLSKLENTKSPHVFVFGGAKPDDLIKLLKKSLGEKSVDSILLSGVIGELALRAKGHNLGAKEFFLRDNGYLDHYDEFLEVFLKYEAKFKIPVDVALFDGSRRVEILVENFGTEENRVLLDKYQIQDIGISTVNYYEKFLKKAGSIYFKGPAGNFEEHHFERGTKELLREIINSRNFAFMGGGHSLTAAKMFNMLKKFDYASLGGGALIHYLCGEELVGLKVLKDSYKLFHSSNYDFIVLGSNTLDIKVDIPEKLSQIEMGEKIKVNENFKLSSGGGGINVSITLSKLEANVGYLGKISSEFKEVLDKTLKKNKIDLVDSKETKRAIAKSILLQTRDNDRVIFTYRGQNDFLEMEDFDLKDFNSNNYYFTALNKKSLLTQIKLAKQIKKNNKNSKICYNPSSYLIKEEGKNLHKLIRFIDVLIFNFDEAKILTGDRDISSCLRSVHALGPKLVVITDGSHGSYAYDGVKETYRRSKPVKKIVDTTGAGDCFAATFFYFFSKNYGVKASLQYASWNSAALITKSGTSNGLLSFKDLAKTKRA